MTYISECDKIRLSLEKEVADMTVTELIEFLEQMKKEGKGDMEVRVEDLTKGFCVEIGVVVFDEKEGIVCLEV